MKNGVSALEKIWQLLKMLNTKLLDDPVILFLCIQWKKYISTKKLYTNVYSPKVETTTISINWWMDQQNGIFIQWNIIHPYEGYMLHYENIV